MQCSSVSDVFHFIFPYVCWMILHCITDHIFFIHSCIDGHLVWFCSLAMGNIAMPSVLLVRVLSQNRIYRLCVCVCLERENLLEWLIVCVPASPTMVVYQQKVRKSSSCSVHEAGCLSWSSVGSMPVKGWTWQQERKQAKRASFPLAWPLYRLPAEGVAQIKGGSFHLRRSGLKV